MARCAPTKRSGTVYDPAGNVANRTANQFAVAFGVDARNQLTTATTSGTLTVEARRKAGRSA